MNDNSPCFSIRKKKYTIKTKKKTFLSRWSWWKFVFYESISTNQSKDTTLEATIHGVQLITLQDSGSYFRFGGPGVQLNVLSCRGTTVERSTVAFIGGSKSVAWTKTIQQAYTGFFAGCYDAEDFGWCKLFLVVCSPDCGVPCYDGASPLRDLAETKMFHLYLLSEV